MEKIVVGNPKEEQRKKLVELIASQVCEDYNPVCDYREPHNCEYCYANDCRIGDLADFLLKNNFDFQNFAKYEFVHNTIDYYVCTNCQNPPIPIRPNVWHFIPHCWHCGAIMTNAEELKKEQEERANRNLEEFWKNSIVSVNEIFSENTIENNEFWKTEKQ